MKLDSSRDGANSHCMVHKGTLNALRRATRHVLTRVAKDIDVDGGLFENALL
jgi:hypothetical protein